MSFLINLFWFTLIAIATYRLFLHKREPSSTLAWLLFILLVPFVGPILFFIFSPQRLERYAIKRKLGIERMVSEVSGPLVEQFEDRPDGLSFRELNEEEMQVLHLARQISEYDITTGNDVKIISNPQDALFEMQKAISNAKHFIHLQYYIISSDEVTKELFENLADAAGRGVEVRILYDALGSLSLKRIYFRKLVEQGVKTAGFLPLSALPQRLNVNFRNHRKLLVIDGVTAFTGGANIGKQYLGKFEEGQWRDYFARVEGPVCRQLQHVFAKDWQFTTQEDLFHPNYYPEYPKPGESLVQVLESGPHSAFHTLHQALFLAITTARSELLLTTPYFIPDGAMQSAIEVAALRGVNVQILLPMKNDSKITQYASRSFYESLLGVGVQIWEYEPTILHAKTLIIDRKWTILGSANMDIRSFRLNFELNLLVYGPSVAEQARSLFLMDRERSHPITLKEYMNRPLSTKLAENACRMLAPIL